MMASSAWREYLPDRALCQSLQIFRIQTTQEFKRLQSLEQSIGLHGLIVSQHELSLVGYVCDVTVFKKEMGT